MHTRVAGLLILGATTAFALGCGSLWSHQETEQQLEAASSKAQALQRKVEDLQHALDTVNRAREGAEAVKGGLEDQTRNLQGELDRAKRARGTAEAAALELEIRIRALQQQLQVVERERDQLKTALAAAREKQRAGKKPSSSRSGVGKDQNPE
ncbi:MAG TPA: hypothetical protein VGQ60_00720 [Nitrospiraceae bacterium]|jgi:chromosome segregation ATPase|nr:hypothetical protein [Nitrospiraceae bacterium]